MSEEFVYPTSQAELADICLERWDAYFAAPSKAKPELMSSYNEAASLYNQRAKSNVMTVVSKSTKDSAKARPKLNVTAPVQVAPPAPKKEGSIIAKIIAHHVAGKTNKEIIAMGFNKSTVGRQVSEYKKLNNG